MRIVQTFWTAGANPLDFGFGWVHPMYNLMSWALSCLCLCRYYREVILYTDPEGKRVLIDKLHLPYSEVYVVYNSELCLPHHWAYAKIKTYSLQKKPFLHIDGDVFIPQPFSKEVEEASLVAQNREIGTMYYKQMMDRVMQFEGIRLPQKIVQHIKNGTLPSINTGIFGGNNLPFIQHFCNYAFEFIEKNELNNPNRVHSKVWCNILFEQIMFAILVEDGNENIKMIYKKDVRDEGYTRESFCDFLHFEQRQLLHILGGHKRNIVNCHLLEKTLLRLYPKYYMRVAQLFPQKNIRFCNKNDKYELASYLNVDCGVAMYKVFLKQTMRESLLQNIDEVYDLERERANTLTYVQRIEYFYDSFLVVPSSDMHHFIIPQKWHPKVTELLNKRFNIDMQCPLSDVYIISYLLDNGIREIPIVKCQREILDVIGKDGILLSKLINILMERMTLCSKKSRDCAKKIIFKELLYLLYNGIVLLQKTE